MSMSTHIVGFKPPDEKWKQMKAVRDACVAAGIEIPEDVDKFFDYCEPDDAGVVTDLDPKRLGNARAVRKWQDDSREGYEIIVAELDPNIKIIRVYTSW